MIAGAGALRELPVGALLRLRVGEPRLGGERTLGRPDLEHLAVAP